jgi:hypothetical protein
MCIDSGARLDQITGEAFMVDLMRILAKQLFRFILLRERCRALMDGKVR